MSDERYTPPACTGCDAHSDGYGDITHEATCPTRCAPAAQSPRSAPPQHAFSCVWKLGMGGCNCGLFENGIASDETTGGPAVPRKIVESPARGAASDPGQGGETPTSSESSPPDSPENASDLASTGAAQLIALRKSLVWALSVIDEGEMMAGDTPWHDCEFFSNPEKGACGFHEAYWTARELVDGDELRASEAQHAKESSKGASADTTSPTRETWPSHVGELQEPDLHALMRISSQEPMEPEHDVILILCNYALYLREQLRASGEVSAPRVKESVSAPSADTALPTTRGGGT